MVRSLPPTSPGRTVLGTAAPARSCAAVTTMDRGAKGVGNWCGPARRAPTADNDRQRPRRAPTAWTGACRATWPPRSRVLGAAPRPAPNAAGAVPKTAPHGPNRPDRAQPQAARSPATGLSSAATASGPAAPGTPPARPATPPKPAAARATPTGPLPGRPRSTPPRSPRWPQTQPGRRLPHRHRIPAHQPHRGQRSATTQPFRKRLRLIRHRRLPRLPPNPPHLIQLRPVHPTEVPRKRTGAHTRNSAQHHDSAGSIPRTPAESAESSGSGTGYVINQLSRTEADSRYVSP